ncbi:MAG: hypothetical protein DRJ64_02660 [Thermoprotei archaeon]|nr:MAG: hypothetical protein DRJ64_02660 [Thermoprotei archaeon]
MKIINRFPPNIETIKKYFAVADNTIFTYGDTIYNPANGHIDRALEKHEAVHSRQQGDEPDVWWAKYIASEDFRLSQEVEAYQTQYREKKQMIKDKNQLFRYANQLATDLSSNLYGKVINHQDAMTAITSTKTYKFNV